MHPCLMLVMHLDMLLLFKSKIAAASGEKLAIKKGSELWKMIKEGKVTPNAQDISVMATAAAQSLVSNPTNIMGGYHSYVLGIRQLALKSIGGDALLQLLSAAKAWGPYVAAIQAQLDRINNGNSPVNYLTNEEAATLTEGIHQNVELTYRPEDEAFGGGSQTGGMANNPVGLDVPIVLNNKMYRSAVAALKNDFIKPDEWTTVQELLNRYQDTIHHDGNGNLKATQYDMNNNKINSNLPVTDEDAAAHLKLEEVLIRLIIWQLTLLFKLQIQLRHI